jgi:hypothetical protein
MRYKSPEWIMSLPHEEQMRLHSINRHIQARADSALEVWGTRAPAPVEGTDPRKYERDLAYMLKGKFPQSDDTIGPDSRFSFNDLLRTDVYALPDDAFSILEPQYRRAASVAAARNDTVPLGEMRKIEVTNPANGHKEIRFYGQTSFVKEMNRPCRRVVSFRRLVDDHGRPC